MLNGEMGGIGPVASRARSDYSQTSFSTLGQLANHIFHNAKNPFANVDNLTGDSVASSVLNMHKLCIEDSITGGWQGVYAG